MLLIVVQFNSIYVYLSSYRKHFLSFSVLIKIYPVTNCLIELILPLVLKRQKVFQMTTTTVCVCEREGERKSPLERKLEYLELKIFRGWG